MTNELVLAATAPESREENPTALTPAQAILRRLVLDLMQSIHSKRNYAKALDHLFAFAASRPLSWALLMEWRAGIRGKSGYDSDLYGLSCELGGNQFAQTSHLGFSSAILIGLSNIRVLLR